MKFKGPIEEVVFAAPIVPERMYMFDQDLKTGLTIIWNSGEAASFVIDGEPLQIASNCIFFLTEFHRIESYSFTELRVIQFNRLFHCIEEHDSEIGCKGLLFFGAAGIPKVELEEEQCKSFNMIWEVLVMEIEEENDTLKLEMLQVLVRRFLILSLRVYKKQHQNIAQDAKSVGLIREYNYLVEKHFKMQTKVADYAAMLYKSPKTLSNVFNQYHNKTPLQVINERRLLEAKRLLKYSSMNIQEVADELNFNDIQSFSHFFRKHTDLAPSKFRGA